jgi:drug/metabolite transporter (DMT)-like permease
LDASRSGLAVAPYRSLWEKILLIMASGLLYAVAITGVGLASRAIPPVPLTIMRLTVASLIFCGILLALRTPLRWQPRRALDLFIIGISNIGLPFVLLAIALRYISGSLASVLFNVGPAITILLAHFLLPDEKLRPAKIAGTALAIAGAVLLVASNSSGRAGANSQSWIGQILIILASAAGAFAVIYTRIRFREADTSALAGGQVFASLAVFLLLGWVTDDLPRLAAYPRQAWLAMIISAVTSPVLGYWLLFYMVKKYGATLGGFAGIATPLFSAIIGILFLGEVLTPIIVVSALLVLAGIWALNAL